MLIFCFKCLLTRNKTSNPTPALTKLPLNKVLMFMQSSRYSCVSTTEAEQFGIKPKKPLIISLNIGVCKYFVIDSEAIKANKIFKIKVIIKINNVIFKL